jgi:FdhD protein
LRAAARETPATPDVSAPVETTPAPARALPAASVERSVERWSAGVIGAAVDRLAEEVPIALAYHGVPHVVMLATPADLEDFAVGFSLSESLVAERSEIRSIEIAAGPLAIDVHIGIAAQRFAALLRERRNLTGRTGCGLCGAETLEQAIRTPAAVGPGPRVSVTDLHAALAQLEGLQPLNACTGSVHAAAWVLPGMGVQLVREDVGRHNALDKVLGALARTEADRGAGYLLITSRASYEMVMKTATLGISLLVAVSAPTALAVRLAEECGLTLVGFARRDRHVVYTHGQRVLA